MFASLKFRLWLTYILVLGVTTVVAGASAWVFFMRNPPQDRRELQRLGIISNLIVRGGLGIDLTSASDADGLTGELQRADAISRVRIAIYGESGTLAADSRRESASPLPEWAYFAGRDPNSRPIYLDASGLEWLFAITPVNEGSILLVSIERPQMTIMGLLRDGSITPLLKAFLLAMAVSSILAVWLAYRFTASFGINIGLEETPRFHEAEK